MKKINISTPKYPNTFTFVDDEDYIYLSQWKWFKTYYGYVARNIKKISPSRIIMHRDIMKAESKTDVDHINHNKLDNRKSNLRICTRSQNMQNMKPSDDGYKGVSYFGDYKAKRIKKWRARIRYNYEYIYLGYHKTEKEAAKAYNIKAKELFGEFAYLNRVT